MTEEEFERLNLLVTSPNSMEMHDEPTKRIKSSRETVLIDIGGMVFKVRKKVFAALPTSRLSRLMRAETQEEILTFCDDYTPGSPPTFFFDRNYLGFNAILDLYRIGGLHLTVDICATVFKQDLNFWGIDELYLDPCCALKYYPEMENCLKELRNNEALREKEINRIKDENFGDHFVGKLRSRLWNVMEYPESSFAARIAGFTSLGIVVLSTLTFIIQTFPEFQYEPEKGIYPEHPGVVKTFQIIDDFAIIFFTLEYCIRFICSPRKWPFFKNPMNLVDLLAILPFYITLALDSMEDMQIIGKAGKLVRLIRVLRIMRIFKLVRHFAGLQSLIYTLNQAYKELGLLMLVVSVAVLTFSSLVYFAEKDVEGKNWTFLDSFWWGIMTLTTVGYDQRSPQSVFGKIIGSVCALSGVFILTLPIPIVVNSFASYYKNRLWRNEVAHKRNEKINQLKQKILSGEKNFTNLSIYDHEKFLPSPVL